MKVRSGSGAGLYRRVAVYFAGFIGGLIVWSLLKLFVLPEPPEAISFYQDNDRLSSGVLFISGQDGLFALRQKDHKWAFPGGKFNASVDMDLFAAMMRISTEVLGYLPPHELQEEIPFMYDPVKELEYTLFLATVHADAKQVFLPRPQEEHFVKAEWIPLQRLDSILDQLHPIVRAAWQGQIRAKIMVLATL